MITILSQDMADRAWAKNCMNWQQIIQRHREEEAASDGPIEQPKARDGEEIKGPPQRDLTEVVGVPDNQLG